MYVQAALHEPPFWANRPKTSLPPSRRLTIHAVRSESGAPRAEIRRAWQLAIAAGIGSMGIGLMAAQAFTLVAITALTVTPTQGVSNAPFTVHATYKTSTCTGPPTPVYYFYFYWDKVSASQQIWSTKVGTCDLKTLAYDTGAKSVLPLAGQTSAGRHLVEVVVLDAAGRPPPNNTDSKAYTILTGKPSVTAAPTSGVPTAKFTIAGKFVWSVSCPVSPISITFRFYWFKVISTKVLLWTKTASACSANAVSTGTSPLLAAPPGLNYPSSFVIQVAVYQMSGASFGPTYTNTTLYQVLPRPSPMASPSTSAQCGQPGQTPCSSPSPSPAPCTALLPVSSPPGIDFQALLALAAVGSLPIGGLVLVFSPGLRSRRHWSKVLAFLWVSLMLTSTIACTPPNQQAGQETPSQAQESPSPSPSPTPSC